MKRIKFLLLPFFAVFTLLFSFSPTVILFLATPRNQIFSGINWWESDYFVYLSFVESGVRGQLQERFLMNTLTSFTAWIHGIYTVSGYLLGHLAGLNSIFIYTFDRFFLGLAFILLLTCLYLSIFKSRFWAFIALVFTFWVPGFMNTFNVNSSSLYRYLSWIQQLNILTRVTGLPHYLLGYIFFILAVWVFVSFRKSFAKKLIFLVFLTYGLTIANPVNSLIFYSALAVYFFLWLLIGVFINSKIRSGFIKDFLVAITVFIFNLPLVWYYFRLLSGHPWGTISNVFGYFIGNNPIPTNELVFALGPAAPLSLLGILFFLGKIIFSKDKQSQWYLFCIAWIMAQGALYFVAGRLKMEQYRFLQGLYYIPMGVLTVGGLQFLGEILTRFFRFFNLKTARLYWVIILTFFSFVITFPTLVVSYRQELFRFTDFYNFYNLYFPTVKQYEAYKFLETETPFASTVLAGPHASLHIPAFSGNANKLDYIDKGEIDKTEFFAGKLDSGKAQMYLKKNNISYVWVGEEEKIMGFKTENYDYLRSIFKNEEVEIYKVI